MKIAITSTAIMHNNIESGQTWRNLLGKGKTVRSDTIYFDFRLNIDVINWSCVNEIPVHPVKSTEKF